MSTALEPWTRAERRLMWLRATANRCPRCLMGADMPCRGPGGRGLLEVEHQHRERYPARWRRCKRCNAAPGTMCNNGYETLQEFHEER